MAKSIQECLGWHKESDGTYEWWVDWNDQEMTDVPTVEYLVTWVANNVLVQSITYVPAASIYWVAIFLDKDHKPCSVKEMIFRTLLLKIVRTAVGED
jgi:hypothetical protein